MFYTLKTYAASKYIIFLLSLLGSVFSIYLTLLVAELPSDINDDIHLIFLIGPPLFFLSMQMSAYVLILENNLFNQSLFIKFLTLSIFYIMLVSLLSSKITLTLPFGVILLLPMILIEILLFVPMLISSMHTLLCVLKKVND